jgi:hypothetical protein
MTSIYAHMPYSLADLAVGLAIAAVFVYFVDRYTK